MQCIAKKKECFYLPSKRGGPRDCTKKNAQTGQLPGSPHEREERPADSVLDGGECFDENLVFMDFNFFDGK